MFRGILSTIYIELKNNCSINKIHNVLKSFHKKNPFVHILNTDSLISTNNVINTNNCLISVCKTKEKKRLVILSAIDNLIKGGAGQAIQNMNLRFELKTTEGLK